MRRTNRRGDDGPVPHISVYIKALLRPETRERALDELCRYRDRYPDLACTLWHVNGIALLLLQELVSIYPSLPDVQSLGSEEANRTCNALALLQCLAVHPRTRHFFIDAHIPLYLYPFLKSQHQTRPYEYLRLSCLGVIGGLVRTNSHRVIHFLVNTEFIPLCFQTIENGSELSTTVATFIVQKVLANRDGFIFMTRSPGHTRDLYGVLNKVIDRVAQEPSLRLLKHALRCYVCLSEDQDTLKVMKEYFPSSMTQPVTCRLAVLDPLVRRWMESLLEKVGIPLPLESMSISLGLQMPRLTSMSAADLRSIELHHYQYFQFQQHYRQRQQQQQIRQYQRRNQRDHPEQRTVQIQRNANISMDEYNPPDSQIDPYIDVNMTTYANMSILFGLHSRH